MSCSIYLLVRSQLMRQLDEFSQSALDTLTAAVDFEADGLEWESNVRRLTFAQAPGGGQLAWAIYAPDGQRLDGTQEAVVGFEPPNGQPAALHAAAQDGNTWRVARRQLRADWTAVSPSLNLPPEDEVAKRWPTLTLAVGVSTDRALASLRPLAMWLAVIATGIWMLAAIGGRWISRRALQPMTRMAQAAGSISALDLQRRLPPSGTNDELDELGTTFNASCSIDCRFRSKSNRDLPPRPHTNCARRWPRSLVNWTLRCDVSGRRTNIEKRSPRLESRPGNWPASSRCCCS